MIRQEIIQASDTLFLKYGIKSISMDDIAREIGISKKTLYEHIESKEDLIKEIMQAHIEEDQQYITDIQSNQLDAIEQMIQIASYVVNILRKMNPRTMYDLKKYYRKIYTSWEIFQRVHIYEVIYKNLSDGIDKDLYRDNLDIDIITKLYVSNSMLIVDDTLFDATKYHRDKVFLEHIKYHMHSICTTKGLRLFKKYLNNGI